MGYITSYNIKTEKVISNFKDILNQITHEDWEGDNDSFYTTTKWYDWQLDMYTISKKFPNILFTLTGEGEESTDIWKSYWLNGSFQVTEAKIVFDKFDKNKLKEFKINE